MQSTSIHKFNCIRLFSKETGKNEFIFSKLQKSTVSRFVGWAFCCFVLNTAHSSIFRFIFDSDLLNSNEHAQMHCHQPARNTLNYVPPSK